MHGRRIFILLALLVTSLALVGAGCGGGDEGAAEPPAAEPAEPAPPAEEPPAEEAPAEETTEGPAHVALAADPGGNLAYDQTALEVVHGEVSIDLTNDSPVPHNVAIEDSGGNVLVEGEIFSGGGTKSSTAALEAGAYTFFCSVPGHRQAGMEGVLTVT